MANFVEQATLKLNDESSGNIRKVNSELRKLFATANKMRNMRIDIGGLTKAQGAASKLSSELDRLRKPVRLNVTGNATSQIAKLTAQLRNLPASKTMRLNVVQNGITPNVPQGDGPRSFVPRHRGFVGAGFGGIGVGLSGFSPAGAGATALAFAAGRSAAREVVAAAAEDTTQRNLGYAAQEVDRLAKAARDATGAQLLLTETDKRAIARNLYNAGVQGDSLDKLTDATAQTQAALSTMFGKEEGRRIQESIIKELDLAGALDAPVSESTKLLNALTATQLTFGADFNQKTYLAALRTSQQATRLTADAMVNFGSIVDEQGQRAGSRLQRLNKILTSAGGEGSGVNKTQIDLLEASGIREAARRNAELLETDFGEFIRQEVAPVLEGRGISLDDAVAVKRGLQQLGFTSQELALVEAEILKRRERQRDRERARQVRFDRFQENARKDIGLALRALAAQFDDVAASVLKPFSELLAPAVIDVAKGFDDLAKGNFSKQAIRSLVSGTALGVGSFALSKPDVAALGVAGFRLNGSAGRLNSAAAALTRAAGAQGAGGTLGGGGAGGRNTRGTSFAAQVARSGGRAVRNSAAGAAIAGGVEYAMGGDPNAIGGAIAGGFLGGLAGSVFGPGGTAVGAMLGSEIGRSHGEAVMSYASQAWQLLDDATKDDPLAKQVKSVLAGVKEANSPEMNAERERNNVMRNAVEKLTAELTTINLRVDQQLSGVPRDLFTKSRLTGEEQSIINALKLGDLESQATRAANALGTIPPAVSHTDEIINALRTPPVAPSALDLRPIGQSSLFDFGIDALDGSASRFDAIFATGANDISAGGDRAADAITAAGQSLGPQGTMIGQNANAAFNAQSLGSTLGSAAAAAFNSQARAPSPIAGGTPVNTGATSVPVE